MFFSEFSRLHYCLFVKVLFSFCCCSRDSLFRLSQVVLFVNNFFYFFSNLFFKSVFVVWKRFPVSCVFLSFLGDKWYLNRCFCIWQPPFFTFFVLLKVQSDYSDKKISLRHSFTSLFSSKIKNKRTITHICTPLFIYINWILSISFHKLSIFISNKCIWNKILNYLHYFRIIKIP